jgi:hypothetical protein
VATSNWCFKFHTQAQESSTNSEDDNPVLSLTPLTWRAVVDQTGEDVVLVFTNPSADSCPFCPEFDQQFRIAAKVNGTLMVRNPQILVYHMNIFSRSKLPLACVS